MKIDEVAFGILKENAVQNNLSYNERIAILISCQVI